MEAPRETSTPQQSVDTVKVSDIRSSQTIGRFAGRYRFEDLKTEGEVAANWEIRPETAGFSVRGDVHGVLDLECARCLGAYTVPVDVQINERYVYDSYVDPYGREKELQAEDFFEVAEEAGALDLKDLAYQFLMLESENHAVCGRAECGFLDGAASED